MKEVVIGTEDVLIPENKLELDSLFRPLAEEFGEELDSDFVFEGNSDKDMAWLYDLVASVGYGKVGIPKDIQDPGTDHCDTIYVNLNNLNITRPSPDLHADEIDWDHNGWLRLWWD